MIKNIDWLFRVFQAPEEGDGAAGASTTAVQTETNDGDARGTRFLSVIGRLTTDPATAQAELDGQWITNTIALKRS